MPAFFLWNVERKDDEYYWVYGVDEWDARDQIARTLGLNVESESAYGCIETSDLIPDLGVIVHKDGTKTHIPDPEEAGSWPDKDCRSRL